MQKYRIQKHEISPQSFQTVNYMSAYTNHTLQMASFFNWLSQSNTEVASGWDLPLESMTPPLALYVLYLQACHYSGGNHRGTVMVLSYLLLRQNGRFHLKCQLKQTMGNNCSWHTVWEWMQSWEKCTFMWFFQWHYCFPLQSSTFLGVGNHSTAARNCLDVIIYNTNT